MMGRNWIVGLLLIEILLAGCAGNTIDDSGIVPAAVRNTDLGMGYMQQGEYSRSMDKFKRALQYDSNYAPAHSGIAVLYEHIQEYEKADEHFQIATDLVPNDSKIHNNYGRFLCRQNRIEESQQQFLLAVENLLYKTPEIAYTNAGICALKGNDKVKAEQHFLAALQANPKFPLALKEMAMLTFEQKMYLRTRAYIQRLRSIRAPTAQMLWLSIQVEQQLGNTNAVSSHILLLKSKFPNSKEAKLAAQLESDEY